MLKKSMAFFLILFATLFTSTSLFAQFEPDVMIAQDLRFDGVYVTSMEDGYGAGNGLKLYVRFFDDGTVATATSNNSPGEVINWLFPGNNAPMALGLFGYKPKNGKLKFATTSAGGKVKYKGVVSNTGELLIEIKSKITRTKFEKIFQFVSANDVINVNTPDPYIDSASPNNFNNKTYPSGGTRTRVKVNPRN